MTNLIIQSKNEIVAPLLSVSLWLFYLSNEIRPQENGSYLLLTACEIGYILTTLIGLVETVFWSAIALLVKTVHVVLPIPIVEQICVTLFALATTPLLVTSSAAAFSIYNFFETEEGLEALDTTIEKKVWNFLSKY